MRKCKIGGKEKEDWEFSSCIEKSTGREYYRKICRVCKRLKDKKTNEKTGAHQAYLREKNYGISAVVYELILKAQSNKCAICGTTSSGSHRTKFLSVDHCHKTFKIRGLLCQQCNTAISMFKDSPELLRKAATYLEP